MKKISYSLFVFLLAIFLCGCNSFEIQGIENFTENDCIFGLNCGLMPDESSFLSNYPYECGDYQYWRNNYGPVCAKTYIKLQYDPHVYKEAKSACLAYFTFSEEQCYYDSYTFSVVNLAGGETNGYVGYPGVRMFGYNDELCTLIFIAFLDEHNPQFKVTAANFTDFFAAEFSRTGDGGEDKTGDGGVYEVQ